VNGFFQFNVASGMLNRIVPFKKSEFADIVLTLLKTGKYTNTIPKNEKEGIPEITYTLTEIPSKEISKK